MKDFSEEDRIAWVKSVEEGVKNDPRIAELSRQFDAAMKAMREANERGEPGDPLPLIDAHNALVVAIEGRKGRN